MPERPALELTVYPKPRYALTTWQYQTDPSKRLTDTELAAEVWHACDQRTADASNILSGQHENPYAQKAFQKSIERAIILNRFATHDHYDQEDQ